MKRITALFLQLILLLSIPTSANAGWLDRYFKPTSDPNKKEFSICPECKCEPLIPPENKTCITDVQKTQMQADLKTLSDELELREALLLSSKEVIQDCEDQTALYKEKNRVKEEVVVLREEQLAESQKRVADLEEDSWYETAWDWGWPIIALGLGAYVVADQYEDYHFNAP